MSMKKISGPFFAMIFGLVIALIALEIFLRVAQPIKFRVKGENIIPPVNETTIIENKADKGLNEKFMMQHNALGFRGPPWADKSDSLAIIAIGGSTTECRTLPDGATWPDQFAQNLAISFNNVWMNNAGMDGMSTAGHLILIKKHILPLKPKILLFLVGVNDQRLKDADFDGSSFQRHLVTLANYSEIASYLLNLSRYAKARSLGLVYGSVELSKLTLSHENIAEDKVFRDDTVYLSGYKKRLQAILDLTRNAGIEPVFLTQPALYGEGVDDLTGLDLARTGFPKLPGRLMWRELELYNTVLRDWAKEKGVVVVDLAHKLAKSTRFFQDSVHLTTEGAGAVGQILYTELCPWLAVKYRSFLKEGAPCKAIGREGDLKWN